MTVIKDLFEPSNDAIDYNYGQKRSVFIKSFYSTSHLEKLKQNNCYYIIGEKGSGKTALALFYQLNSPDNSSGKLLSIDITQYKKFIKLKQKHMLEYSDYASIWRTTLCMLMSQFIVQKNKKWIHKFTGKFKKIEDAIKAYDENSLLPEIDTAVSFAETLDIGEEVQIPKTAKVKGAYKSQKSETSQEIRFHLLEAEKALKKGLGDITLENDFVIFLDGLDSRPTDIGIMEFRACLQGLLDAVWQLNNQFFLTISDTKGRMRVCVLIRPDIFDNLDIPNSNSKLNDNAVILSWDTSEEVYKQSSIFEVLDKYFYSQNQDDRKCGWNSYFPYFDSGDNSESFIELYRNTFVRPRDFFTAIKYLIRKYKSINNQSSHFEKNELKDPRFTKDFADYLLGEVKNHASYYISNSDFSEYINYFSYLDGAQNFSYENYKIAFSKFKRYADSKRIETRKYYDDPDTLLQFFFSINIIGYYDEPNDGSKPFIHWSFRERNLSNICPKVKTESNYMVFSGIKKALDIGKKFNPQIQVSGKRYEETHKYKRRR